MLIFRCVGLIYLVSGLWCALKPELASSFLGFELKNSIGQSEFLSVYGGLQFGFAMAILISSFVLSYRVSAVFFALVTSFGLFGFRLVSFLFIDQSPTIITMLCLEGFLAFLLFVVWIQQRRVEFKK
jgi:hypothetical protein